MHSTQRARQHKFMGPILLALVLLAPTLLRAKIDKEAVPSKTGLQLYWWPDLAAVKGWHHDEKASRYYAVNAEVPDGATFSNAEAVIYAKAMYKPRTPETKSLAMLIQQDRQTFLSHDPGLQVTEIPPLKTADGKILKTYTFFPEKKGNWEEVAYGEEDDFYILFVLSARSKEGFDKALGAYEEFVSKYE